MIYLQWLQKRCVILHIIDKTGEHHSYDNTQIFKIRSGMIPDQAISDNNLVVDMI